MQALRGDGGAGEGPGRLMLNGAGAQWTGWSSPRVAVSEAPCHSGSPSLFTEIDPRVGLHHRYCPQRLSTYQQPMSWGSGLVVPGFPVIRVCVYIGGHSSRTWSAAGPYEPQDLSTPLQAHCPQTHTCTLP